MGEEKKLIYRTDVDHLNIDALIEIQENEDIQDTVTKKLKEWNLCFYAHQSTLQKYLLSLRIRLGIILKILETDKLI